MSWGTHPTPYLSTALNADLIAFCNASRCLGIDAGANGISGLGELYTQAWINNGCGCLRAANTNYPSAMTCTIAPLFRQGTALTFDALGNVTAPTADQYDTLMGEFQTTLATANSGQTGSNVIAVSHVMLFLEPDPDEPATPQRRFYLTLAERTGLQVWQNAIYTKAKTRWPNADVSIQSSAVQVSGGGSFPSTATDSMGFTTPCNEYFAAPGETPPMVASGVNPGQYFDSYTPLLLLMPDSATLLADGLARAKHQREAFGTTKNIGIYQCLGFTWQTGASDWTYWPGSAPPAADLTTLAAQAAVFRDDSLVEYVIFYRSLYGSELSTAAYEAGLSAFMTAFHSQQAAAPLAVTSDNVVKLAGSLLGCGTLGEYVSAGSPVYRSFGTIYNASAFTSAQAAVVGVSLTTGYAGQPIIYIRSGKYRPGFTVTKGQQYVLTEDGGGVTTPDNVVVGRYMTRIGIGINTTTIRLRIQASGAAVT